jgi:hypothetical protein
MGLLVKTIIFGAISGRSPKKTAPVRAAFDRLTSGTVAYPVMSA